MSVVDPCPVPHPRICPVLFLAQLYIDDSIWGTSVLLGEYLNLRQWVKIWTSMPHSYICLVLLLVQSSIDNSIQVSSGLWDGPLFAKKHPKQSHWAELRTSIRIGCPALPPSFVWCSSWLNNTQKNDIPTRAISRSPFSFSVMFQIRYHRKSKPVHTIKPNSL